MKLHLTRQQLIKAARGQQVTVSGHLQECAECRELVSLLSNYLVAGKLHLPNAPTGWVERAIEIGSKSPLSEKIKSFVARIVFDSWAMPQPLGVRGESVESDRRIRFEHEGVRFDLRVEKQTKGWAFVAQIKGNIDSTIHLEADKKKLLPDSAGLYQWSGSRPPRKITLRSDEFVIELPELTWKKPQSN
ncbi:MAG: hypothetical protein IPH59_11165 [bacterium]|nr:hypothetical protein [bacterium]